MAPDGQLPYQSPAATVAGGRDLRLDFFRGISLLFIFIDHIPDNTISYLTLANFVFNDAAEIFVFISGYTAAIVFGGMAARSGALYASLQVLRRCWTLYVAHIFLFVIFTAQVAYTAEKFENPMFIDEMKVAGFLLEPHVAILKALTLQFQPEFMGILPLYIVLLLGYSVLLPVLPRYPLTILGASVLLYVATPLLGINFAAYPGGRWFHNPFAWQVLFVLGAIAATFARTDRFDFSQRKPWFPIAVGFLAASVVVKLALTLDGRVDVLPANVVAGVWLFLDKTNLGPLRLLNFLALVVLTVRLVPQDSAFLRSALARPIVRCGQHSLYIFCLGILLSYLGHLVLVEISHAIPVELAVSAAGCAIMIVVAEFLHWSKSQARNVEKRPPPLMGGTVAGQGGEL
ncbi:MAG TPA: OpgC domain-containing protein [Alphaproteobacteria bacterium]|nr:OpgC domain-containing protein [Alphaproteobacteria bacterium]